MIILLVLTLTLGSDALRCHNCQNKVPLSASVEGVPCFDIERVETGSNTPSLCEAQRFCVIWTFIDGRTGLQGCLLVFRFSIRNCRVDFSVLFVFRHHRMHEMWTIAIDDPVAWASATRWRADQKRLNLAS